MQYTDSNLSPPELSGKIFLGIWFLLIVKIFALLLLSYVQFIIFPIPHLWGSFGTAPSADLLWAWCWLPFSLKQRQLQEGLLSSFHSALIFNILLSDVSPGKLSQVKSKRFLLLVLFRRSCYLLAFCMLQQPSFLGSIEKDPCTCEFLT